MCIRSVDLRSIPIRCWADVYWRSWWLPPPVISMQQQQQLCSPHSTASCRSKPPQDYTFDGRRLWGNSSAMGGATTSQRPSVTCRNFHWNGYPFQCRHERTTRHMRGTWVPLPLHAQRSAAQSRHRRTWELRKANERAKMIFSSQKLANSGGGGEEEGSVF